jgi:serine/threonine protein kinase
MTTFARVRAPAADQAAGLDPRFGRFTDVRLLRAGSKCTVLEARDARTGGRRVAIKIPLHSDVPWVIDAVAREGETLRRIGTHPHVISLIDRLRLADGRPALVLDRCSGSLRDLADTYRPSPRVVLAIGVKLAGALEAVHRSGYLHTDVRPANVYLTTAGEPVLAAFDEAISSDPSDTPVHALHATTVHTAPELLEGATPTAATDVYGIAVTLYELLAGHPAFTHYRGEAQAETSLRILRGVHAPLPAQVPIEVADLLSWALAIDPADRPPTPAWLAEELRRLSAHIRPRPGAPI